MSVPPINIEYHELYLSSPADGWSDDAFLEHCEERCSEAHSVLLVSGGDVRKGRYSVCAAQPALLVHAKGRSSTLIGAEGVMEEGTDPFRLLAQVQSAVTADSGSPLAYGAGAYGYLAYELKNTIERLPQTAVDDLGLPDMWLMYPTYLAVHDREEGSVAAYELSYTMNERTLPPIPSGETEAAASIRAGNSFEKQAYIDAINKLRNLIVDGDLYQANLSQRFVFASPDDPYAVWRELLRRNPAPYFAYINAGTHRVLSTSMEQFLHSDGTQIESTPIKGTRKRGSTEAEDLLLRNDLLSSQKETAELSMIVDLVRNDIGRVSVPGSVKVLSHRDLDSYANVHHLSSTIAGELRRGISHTDILKATFPPGSVTGCPKIRALEVIDMLEPVARHVYTGAIGYLGCDQRMHLSVAIRTAVHLDGRYVLGVGGGIVYDSEPAMEYQETIDKGETFFRVLGR
ncbi:MAG: aminodeoxychorismate/anthranilate synthase component I [Ectothiorhodospiraceae bacterium]|nr:aminodeoxychorismate/anthranilate synthase component I [Ectothiorhodospiraceae bacterium]